MQLPARTRCPHCDRPPHRRAQLRRRRCRCGAVAGDGAVAAFDGWQWISLALTTVVVFWGGAEFHRAALSALRHGAATMDTLISIGTLAAWAWSAVAMLFLDAGGLHYRMSIDWSLQTGGSPGEDLYLVVAAVVTTLVLAAGFGRGRAGPGLRCAAGVGRRSNTAGGRKPRTHHS
jgi:Cu+-exporting ATPase